MGSPDRRRALKWILGGALAVAGLAITALAATIYVNEALYPWQDNACPLTVVHVENESDRIANLFYRWPGHDETWHHLALNDVRLADELAASEPGKEFWSEFPAVATAGLLQVKVVPIADFPETLLPPIALHPDEHICIRIAEHQSVWLATGGEDWLGGPDCGQEALVAAAR
jgi:hypothetical protein